LYRALCIAGATTARTGRSCIRGRVAHAGAIFPLAYEMARHRPSIRRDDPATVSRLAGDR
jgi:hypothetical protein